MSEPPHVIIPWGFLTPQILSFLFAFDLWVCEGHKTKRSVRILPRATVDTRVIVDVVGRGESREEDHEEVQERRRHFGGGTYVLTTR